MDPVQLRISVIYTIINKKNQVPNVCSKKNFQIVISGFVTTFMRIAQCYVDILFSNLYRVNYLYTNDSDVSGS